MTFLSRILAVSGSLLLSCHPVAAQAPRAEAPVNLKIEAQPLADALAEFAQQTGLQMIVPSEVARNLMSPQLAGDFTPEAALKRLLSKSDLQYHFINARTVAIRTGAGREPAPGGAPRADASQSGGSARSMTLVSAADIAADKQETVTPPGPDPKDEEEGAAEQESTVTVTGSRIRGSLGEQSQPVLTITREDIERYGVSSVGELFRYIPQVTSFQLGQATTEAKVSVGPAPLDVNTNRVTATLRGAPPGGTLLLVNGRRVAKNGQAGGLQGNDAYDLGGIPLSAVERVDVLLDGASAIYGADAVGGVINVILRKEYAGTEARVSYENTFDTDASVTTLSATHGFALNRFSGLVSASWEDANALMWSDRWFLRSFDRRFLGGPNLISAFTYGGRGVVQAVSGNLPGINRNTVAIPAGSTGRNLTVQDYANSGPLPALFDFGDYARYSTPYQRKSVATSFEYEFAPVATVFVDGRWNDSRNQTTTTPIVATAVVPAGAPGNPFGVPVRVRKFFFDLPSPEGEAISENRSLTAGVRGKLRGDWRYEAAALDVRSRPDLQRLVTSFNAARLAAAFASATPPALLYDSTAGVSPNPSGTLEALLAPSMDGERSDSRVYDFQADGSLFALPAGRARLSVGMEYREEHVDFPTAQPTLSLRAYDRRTSGFFAETLLPLISEKQGFALAHRLALNLAVRHDRYSDFSEATNPRYGLVYSPVSWLSLRASRGKGYKVPTLVQLYRPQFSTQAFLPPFPDAARGNEPVFTDDGLIFVTSGNPALRPERSRNTTAGLLIEAPFAAGLSLGLDYFDTQYLDRVGSLEPQDRIVLFPDTIIRADPLPGDPPGWPGPMIGYEDVAINIASNRVSGYDLSLRYDLTTAFGEWRLRANATRTTRNEIRSVQGQPQTDADRLNSSTFNLPVQVTGSLFYQRGAVGMGVLGSYREATWGDEDLGPTIPSAMRWDLQGSYDFSRAPGGASLLARVLADTRISLTIFNLLDTVPPLDIFTFMPDNTTVDSRLRRYSISLARKF